MAEILPNEVKTIKQFPVYKPRIGVHLLESLTTGMYCKPLMIYREYIQNSADAIDEAITMNLLDRDQGQISIHIDGQNRSVSIEDNGIGVNASDASAILSDIGRSRKFSTSQRGFRGIGRLGGLGYCDRVVFETKVHDSPIITKVEWSSSILQDISKCDVSNIDLTEAVSNTCIVSHRQVDSNNSEHFFRVTLHNIHQCYDDVLMDFSSVSTFLSQVAPVYFDKNLCSFSKTITNNISQLQEFQQYSIQLNGKQIFRPFSDSYVLSTERSFKIQGVQLFKFVTDNNDTLAIGWYAVSDLSGSLPRICQYRGIRVRQGNIEVGSESYLNNCFTEPRFNFWHVGEIHASSKYLIPNARRDGFEQSEHLESFLQQATALGKHLSRECRRAARLRNERQKLNQVVDQVEQLSTKRFLPLEGFITHRRSAIEKLVSTTELLCSKVEIPKGILQQLEAMKRQSLRITTNSDMEAFLDRNVIESTSKYELVRMISEAILRYYENCTSADELLEMVLAPISSEAYPERKQS